MPGSLRTVETVVYSQQSVDQFEILRLSESCEFVAPYRTLYFTVDTSTVLYAYRSYGRLWLMAAEQRIQGGSVRS